MTNEEIQQYCIRRAITFQDGYGLAASQEQFGWQVSARWGEEYLLGNWPLVMVFLRTKNEHHEIMLYEECDVTIYRAPTIEIRDKLVDEIAFKWWKIEKQPWIAGYTCTEQLPASMRGPYRREE